MGVDLRGAPWVILLGEDRERGVQHSAVGWPVVLSERSWRSLESYTALDRCTVLCRKWRLSMLLAQEVR